MPANRAGVTVARSGRSAPSKAKSASHRSGSTSACSGPASRWRCTTVRGQEAFLVVAGECVLIVEGKERQLRTWDFVHCPPDTEHVIVGAGNEAAVVVAVGARGRGV